MNKILVLLEHNHENSFQEVLEDAAYVTNTDITQTVYIKNIELQDQKPFKDKKTFKIFADRIISIKGAKFTTSFQLELIIEKKKRSLAHLSGLEISKLNETVLQTPQN